jgi:hypothetical protein
MIELLASWGDVVNTPSNMWLLMVNSTKASILIFFVRFPKAVVICSLARASISEFSWMIHYTTSRKVAGSIPDEVTGFFN